MSANRSNSSIVVSLLLLAIALGACGESGDAEPENVAIAAEPAAEMTEPDRLPLPRPTGEREVGARVYEYSIELTRDTVEAGEQTFHVVNAGNTTHIFVVRNDDHYFPTEHLEPGDSATLTATLDPGEYHVLCMVRDEFDHISEGERVTLIVE